MPVDWRSGRLDHFRYANGGTLDRRSCAERMQHVMQTNCAVFRTGEVLQEGKTCWHEVWPHAAMSKVTDRSLIWNSDLLETLEFDNLIVQAAVTMDSR